MRPLSPHSVHLWARARVIFTPEYRMQDDGSPRKLVARLNRISVIDLCKIIA